MHVDTLRYLGHMYLGSVLRAMFTSLQARSLGCLTCESPGLLQETALAPKDLLFRILEPITAPKDLLFISVPGGLGLGFRGVWGQEGPALLGRPPSELAIHNLRCQAGMVTKPKGPCTNLV